MTETPTPEAEPLDKAESLGRALLALRGLDPVHRAAEARHLGGAARTILAAVGDQATAQAAAAASYAAVAAELGVSTVAVNKAVTRDNRRTRAAE